jgi:hypothetical protein
MLLILNILVYDVTMIIFVNPLLLQKKFYNVFLNVECFVWKLFNHLISTDKTVRKRRKSYAMMTLLTFVWVRFTRYPTNEPVWKLVPIAHYVISSWKMHLKLRYTLQQCVPIKCAFPEWISAAIVDFIVLPGMVKLYSRPHRYPVSLSKIPKFLHSAEFTIFGNIKLQTYKSKLRYSKITTLQKVITSLSAARFFTVIFQHNPRTYWCIWR